MRTTWMGVGLVIAIATMACGGSDPETELIEQSRAVELERGRVETARATVERRAAEFEEAKRRLTEARAAVRAAEEKMAKTKASVDHGVTDALLFRSVQKRLLEDEDLERFAIAARVAKGVVTLTGTVSNEELRKAALEIARATPGVNRVESQIEISVAGRKAEKTAKN